MLREDLADGGKLGIAFAQWQAVETLRRELLSLLILPLGYAFGSLLNLLRVFGKA